jgi:hypothetical protein
MVRPGETLASIAELYYGDPRRESVLVAENGLASEGGASIVVGLKLVIPTVSYHRVAEGETWSGLAERYYGDSRRAFALVEANSQNAGKPPDVGAEILVPYPLRHVATQHDAMRQIAKDCFGGSQKELASVRRFNFMKPSRTERGEIVLVPLPNLLLSPQGRHLAEAQLPGAVPQGETRDKQLRIRDELPLLHEHVQHGRYVEAVGLANRLIGMGDLTGNQVVTIDRELGIALIALDREDLASDAFKMMLEKQPDLELGIGATSPKVLRVLENAKKSLAETHAAVNTIAAPGVAASPKLSAAGTNAAASGQKPAAAHPTLPAAKPSAPAKVSTAAKGNGH